MTTHYVLVMRLKGHVYQLSDGRHVLGTPASPRDIAESMGRYYFATKHAFTFTQIGG